MHYSPKPVQNTRMLKNAPLEFNDNKDTKVFECDSAEPTYLKLERIKLCSMFIIHNFYDSLKENLPKTSNPNPTDPNSSVKSLHGSSDRWISGLNMLTRLYPFDSNPLVCKEAIHSLSHVARSIKDRHAVTVIIRILEDLAHTNVCHIVAHALTALMDILDAFEPVKTKEQSGNPASDSAFLPTEKDAIIDEESKRRVLEILTTNQEPIFIFPWIRESVMEFIGRHNRCL